MTGTAANVLLASGGGGAVAVFALFVAACVVLAGFVITFSVQLNRRTRAQLQRDGEQDEDEELRSDEAAAATLEDVADDRSDRQHEADRSRPEPEHQCQGDQRRGQTE